MSESPHQSQANQDNLPRSSTKIRALNWLVVLGLLYTLYFAKTLLLTLIVTFLLALLLSPLVTLFRRAHVPRVISALVLVTLLFAPFSFLGVQLAQPVQKWAQLLPELSNVLDEQIDSINSAIQSGGKPVVTPPTKEKSTGFSFFGWFGDEPVEAQDPEQNSEQNMVTERIKQGGLEVLVNMLAAAPLMIAQLLTGLVLILFLLIFGPGLFHAYVLGLKNAHNEQQVIHLATTIQTELSRYIGTTSLINAGLGACTAIALKILGVEDALLWGVLAALLNFIPYVGSVICFGILSLAGLTQYGIEALALLPPLTYLVLNLVESQVVTPTVLGRKMRLNPLIVMLWLIIWGWLWGAVGVLLAVPLLVCIKLIIGQLGIWPQWIAIIESEG
jgi:predicted PurR-regulated permease PerM